MVMNYVPGLLFSSWPGFPGHPSKIETFLISDGLPGQARQ
jgi:hypothetical protein